MFPMYLQQNSGYRTSGMDNLVALAIVLMRQTSCKITPSEVAKHLYGPFIETVSRMLRHLNLHALLVEQLLGSTAVN